MSKAEIKSYMIGIDTALSDAKEYMSALEYLRFVVGVFAKADKFIEVIWSRPDTDIDTAIYALTTLHELTRKYTE